jgi:DNA-binding winged helix-turn-helix (wHTH) protein
LRDDPDEQSTIRTVRNEGYLFAADVTPLRPEGTRA